MTYHLFLGDRSYSSWSLRAWHLFERFGIARKTSFVGFHTQDVARQLADVAPARTVPALKLPDGTAMWESLAIAEELATRHPDLGLWTTDPSARAVARTIVSEFHAGFFHLRNDCPMNLRMAYSDFHPSSDLQAEIARLETLWAYGRQKQKDDGPWLFGAYSIADAFFAPVAARIAGYGLPVGPEAANYVAAHLIDSAFRRWRAMALISGETLPWYAKDNQTTDWPGPRPLFAKSVDATAAENSHCPYSGDPVTHYLELDGRTFGFCNAFCRDKTVADPEAWPDFKALL